MHIENELNKLANMISVFLSKKVVVTGGEFGDFIEFGATGCINEGGGGKLGDDDLFRKIL